MRQARSPVINSNINHFCSPNRFAKAHITRINPDKSTFLNSNLLVSNILNHLCPDQCQTTSPQSDAYINRQQQNIKHLQQAMQKKDMINRVKHLAKCRSQTSLSYREKQQELIRKRIDEIAVMRIEMNEKARDIMSRKEDTAYLGRNIFLEGEKFLKQMKDHNPADKTNKLEATRMLMKERAKSKGKNRLKNNKEHEHQYTLNHSTSIHQSDLNNNSSLEATMIESQRSIDHRGKQKQRDQSLGRMIRNGSYQSVLTAQKRQAVWSAFSDNWAQGFKKNEDLITTKKGRKMKKAPRNKYANISENSQLEYNDKVSRFEALKNYKNTFDQTAVSYQLLSS